MLLFISFAKVFTHESILLYNIQYTFMGTEFSLENHQGVWGTVVFHHMKAFWPHPLLHHKDLQRKDIHVLGLYHLMALGRTLAAIYILTCTWQCVRHYWSVYHRSANFHLQKNFHLKKFFHHLIFIIFRLKQCARIKKS